MKKTFCLLAVLGCAWIANLSVRAANQPVFQIGTADGDYRELAVAGNWAAYPSQFSNDVDFVVGKSDPAHEWAYVLPGPEDSWAGSKPHSSTIHFQIPAPGANYYRLVVDFVSTHPYAPPRLILSINGDKVEHILPAGGSDDALTNPRAGRNYTLQQLIPPSLLRAGENTISIMDAEGSWALYDDVRLEGGLPVPAETLAMQAEPLPFFKRTPDGLRRAVRLSVENLAGRGGPAEVTWKTRKQTGTQAIDLHFAKNDALILVPDVDQVELTLRTAQQEFKTPVMLPPAKKWLIYIIPSTHTDIGYTDFQERVKVRHAENGLRELEWLKEYPFLKWNSETFWQLNALLELHPEKKPEVFALMRQKRWGMSASYANMLTGLCSHEALNRYTLDARNLATEGGFDLDSLILDDVPSAVGSLPLVMANSGIKYFIEGANGDRAPHVGEGLKNPFYWEGADGSRVLSYISYDPAYAVAGDIIPTVPRAMERLPAYLARFGTADYPCDAAVLNGSYSDNREVGPWLPQVITEWNTQWEYPKLIPALPGEFLAYVEKNYSNSIPVLKTDFGGWWEDGAGSSALETELDRRTQERIVTAEMLHSLATILTGARYPKTNVDQVWHNILLYDEHTWGAAGSIDQPDSEQTLHQWNIKSAFARDADTASRALLTSGMAELAGIVPSADLVVFNSLAWSRTAIVKTDLTGPLQDAETKKEIACQSLPEGGSCFLANDLPSVGYRTYKNNVGTYSAPDAATITTNEMENEFYRVTLNPQTGGIQSLYDKQLNRELVDTNSESDLGELVYVTGGEGTYAVESDLTHLPAPKFAYHWQSGAGISHSVGPVYGELTSKATAKNLPGITLRVRLYHGLKRLDLICEIDKTETVDKEAVYMAFPFAMDTHAGGLWLEYPDEITEPLADQHTSACRDWYSVQRWLAESDGNATVELSPLDTPLVTLGHMTASTWPRELSLERGHVYAYVMNNYWHTNYKAKQGGHFVFHFSLTSGGSGFSKRDAMVNGWNMFCPPVAAAGQGDHKPVFSAAAGSLFQVAPEGLPLTAIKQSEDAQGFIFRLCDFAGAGGQATLTLPKAASELSSCDLVESHAQALPGSGPTVTVPVKRFGPVTVKVKFAP